MIIKMEEGSSGWCVIDRVDRVSWYPYDLDEKCDLSTYDETIYSIAGKCEVGVSYKAAYISAAKENGKTIAIVTEKKVYLLNDDGKTIERLN